MGLMFGRITISEVVCIQLDMSFKKLTTSSSSSLVPLDKLVILVMLEDTELLGQCVLSLLYEKPSWNGGELDFIVGKT